MPHSPQEKKKTLTRVRRIRGQVEALERALEASADCSSVLQQLAALRGAVNGLMSQVLESHIREGFEPDIGDDPSRAQRIEDITQLVRSYLK
ncbi:regulator protein that represses frmRAB operon [gamma proteobacterium HTCC5015]|nr:regulator protein that represses frmRAB operon [gamma proteobacterium HTCC5015]